jgi:hypothetical protein
MSEFIDREKAIANIKAAYCCGCENYNGVRCRACQIMDAMDVLEDEPAVVPDVQRWRKTAEEPPTRKDGDEIGTILCAGYHCNIRDGLWLENIMPWHVVRDNPGMFPLWMPLPKLPDLSVPERRCMMGND